MFKKLLLITWLSTFIAGSVPEFRFDYKFSRLADGWLKLHTLPATWNEARLRCQAEGAVLVSPSTTRLRKAIFEHVSRERGTDYTIFTGVHATFSKGDYTSIEGVPLLKMPVVWYSGQPDNLKNSQSCLAMTMKYNGTMDDVSCTDVFPYVCYKKKTAMIITACGTHDAEYNLDSRTGNCYKFHRRGQTWSRAFMTCAAEGGYLVIINSEQESLLLKELFAKNPDNVVSAVHPGVAAIGFHNWGEHGTWLTIHGETLKEAGYDRFEKGQPDNVTNARSGDAGEFCGSIFRSGNLNDIWCNVAIPFICEKKPDSLENEFGDATNNNEEEIY